MYTCSPCNKSFCPYILQVARRMGVNRHTIIGLVRKYRASGSVDDLPRRKRGRITTAAQDQHILQIHRQQRWRTAALTARETLGTHGRYISARTVRNRLLTMANMRCRRPFKGIVLTPRHRGLRDRWARRNRRVTQAAWAQVLFTDEKRFRLQENDCRTRVYRERGERFNDNCVIERDRYGGGSVMIWAGVSMHNKTNIVFINGNLTAARYRDEVLQPEVVPMMRNNRGLSFLQDGAPAHTARATLAFLNANNVNIKALPARSPDLNVIENIWDELNRRVRRNGIAPQTIPQLRAKIAQEWANLPQNYIHRYVTSMRRRCIAVINAQGGHTRY